MFPDRRGQQQQRPAQSVHLVRTPAAELPARLPVAEPRRAERVFRGDVMELGGNRPFALDGEQAFVVRRGDVHIFSVPRVGRALVGPRRHLGRISPGGLVLGLGRGAELGSRGLLAVPTSGALVELGTHADLDWLLGDAGEVERGRALVEGWVTALSAGLSRVPSPEGSPELELGEEIELAAGSARVQTPRGGVSWCRPIEGELHLCGRPALRLLPGAFAPLARGCWFEASGSARFDLVATSRLPDRHSLWQGLASLGRLVLEDSEREVAEAEVAEVARARDRSLAAAATLAGACQRLAGSLRPSVFSPDEGADELRSEVAPREASNTLAACRLVGAAAGIVIKTPPRTEGRAAARDPLGTVLRGSRVRSRKVALRGQWWREDHGPLLAFVPGEGREDLAVALLPRRGRTLVCRPWVPAGRGGGATAPRVEVVDEAVAATLGSFAFSLYRSFPEGKLSLAGVLRFGLRGCGRDLGVVALLGLLAALLGLLPPMATGILFNDIIPGAQRSQILQLSVLLLATGLAGAGLDIARGIALLRVRTRTATSVQAAVWDRLLRLPMKFFRPYTAGDLAVRASGIETIQQTLSGATTGALLTGVFSLMNVGLMFHYAPTLAPRATLLIGVAVLLNVTGGLLQLGPQRALVALQARVSGLVLQLLSSIGKLRVAGAEVRAFARWVGLFSRQRRLQFVVQLIGNWLQAFAAAFPLLASVVIYWTLIPTLGTSATGSAASALPRTGDFLAFLAAFGACLAGVLGTCSALISSLVVLPLYEQARPILQSTAEADRGRSAPGNLTGDLEVQHASFRYGTDTPLVIRDLSFRIRPGEMVAFVGASGSGKSTLLKLLLGFEFLESGSIYYDGQEIGGLDIHQVRRQMGVVLQNGQLMPGDILTNIIGSGKASLEQAWEAARLAGLADDIKSMPMGMHTVINDGAGTLSGGQRQRLMIARAIVHRPRILLLDEATSALDNRTQAIVSASLERLAATRIVIAHRLSTIVNAHRIFVLDRGRIVQTGTYSELIADRSGAFYELASRQVV